MESQSTSNPQRHGLPKPSQQWPERERVLEAMVRVAAAKSYEATTVADVIERAEVSPESFEKMFDDKNSCFLEAYDRVVDALLAHVLQAFESASAEPWPTQIVAGLRALVEWIAAEADIVRLGMVEAPALEETVRERYRAALARFTPLLEEGRDYSGRGESLPGDTASFAIGGAASMIFDEIRAGRGPELGRILPDLVFAVLMPYLGPEAAEAEMRRVRRG
jgi:AcrR family transcriptional regulator